MPAKCRSGLGIERLNEDGAGGYRASQLPPLLWPQFMPFQNHAKATSPMQVPEALKHWEVMWLIRLLLLYQNMLPKPSKIDFPICLWVQTLWTPTHMYLQCRIKNVTAGFIKCVLSEFDWVDAGLTIGLPESTNYIGLLFFSCGCLVVLTQALNDSHNLPWPSVAPGDCCHTNEACQRLRDGRPDPYSLPITWHCKTLQNDA